MFLIPIFAGLITYFGLAYIFKDTNNIEIVAMLIAVTVIIGTFKIINWSDWDG